MSGYDDVFGPDGKLRDRRPGFVGGDPVSTHDQVREEALQWMREADGFLLVALERDGETIASRSLLSFDGSRTEAIEILLSTAEWLHATAAEILTGRHDESDA